MKRYFIVDRYRKFITLDYAREFLFRERVTFYISLKEAAAVMHEGFYDDSDYGVFSIDEKGDIERCK